MSFDHLPLHPDLVGKRRLLDCIPDLTDLQLRQQRAASFPWFGHPYPLTDEELAIYAAMLGCGMHASCFHHQAFWDKTPDERWPTMKRLMDSVAREIASPTPDFPLHPEAKRGRS